MLPPAIEPFLLALLFTSLRTGAALTFLPALGGQLIPVRVRIGLAGAVSWLVIGSGHAPTPPTDLLSLPGFAAIAGELLIGLAAALSLHAAFAVALAAGDWLAQSMGLGFAQLVDPTMPQAPILSGLFAMLMWALLLTGGGHLVFLDILIRSYAAMPNAAALFEPGRLSAVTAWGGYAFASAFIAALPVGATLLMVNLAIGVAARSAPQLNLFSIGFPLMLLIGLIALPLALPALAASFQGALTASQSRLADLLLG
ncbi:flagellar biosynthetic protein FliR [Sandaracinobacter neustonicus]|uniref:Flagellar biosynthetic protein FliR n=1 Tax=Sandaracinobacter neustonicus TaxID=1715348 RepID=A0A501XIN5_9SPHN|nr:flagellar biosynthetic protein FliR [Sandaracinobacter neustonicus]TPE60137.1 flagellar biosynthetic protein FliR [Sandaracinobacter neustonicus]